MGRVLYPGIIPQAFLYLDIISRAYTTFSIGAVNCRSSGHLMAHKRGGGVYPRGLITGMKKHFGPFRNEADQNRSTDTEQRIF